MARKVLVIGLGRMGSALAATLLKNDYEVSVWNRTASKDGAASGGGCQPGEQRR